MQRGLIELVEPVGRQAAREGSGRLEYSQTEGSRWPKYIILAEYLEWLYGGGSVVRSRVEVELAASGRRGVSAAQMVELGNILKDVRWCSWIPKKINIFVWRVLRNRLPTRGSLQGRGIPLETVRCPLCNEQEETVNHLLGSCTVANAMWGKVFRWMQLQRIGNRNSELQKDFANAYHRQRHTMIPTKFWI
ncbi:hypothetical protein LXL04_007305 [Taraxacum kok-saghyz]